MCWVLLDGIRYKVDAIKMPKIGAGGDIPRPLARGEQVSGEIQHDYSF